MLTVELLLALADGAPPDALDGALAAEEAALAAAVPGATTRLALGLAHHRDAALAAGDPLARLDEVLARGLVAGLPVTSFDAVLEVSAPDEVGGDALVAAVAGVAARLGPALDAARSVAVAGPDHVIKEGDGPIQLFVGLRRVDGLTHDEFARRWLHDLVAHTTQTPGKVAYRQLHADPDLSARAAAAAGVGGHDLDGVALEWYPDLAALCGAADWASRPGAPIAEAEARLIDFPRAQAILAHVP